MTVRKYIAVMAGMTVILAWAHAQQVLVRTAARSAAREETRQTLHVVDMTTGEVWPWRDMLPGMQTVTPLAASADGAWAFMTTRALWPHTDGWPASMAVTSAISLDPVGVIRAQGAGVLLGHGQKFGCAIPQVGEAAPLVVMLESGSSDSTADSGLVTLRSFSPSSGFGKAPLASWRVPGVPVQALPLAPEPQIAVLCRGSLGVYLVVVHLQTREVVADVMLSALGDPARGPGAPVEMALFNDAARLLVLTSGFSLESPGGEQRTWLHQVDTTRFEIVEEAQEFPGAAQTPSQSLWPLANGACWLATMSPGEGFAYLYRLPLAHPAPRAVEQPFTSVAGPLRVAPAPGEDGVAVGVRNRLELWPEGEPAGTPLPFENDIAFAAWCESGVLVGEGHRLHLVEPESAAIVETVSFQSGLVAEALVLGDDGGGWDAARSADATAPQELPGVVVFRGEAVGRERRVIGMHAKGRPEVPWRIEFDAATLPWLRVHPRSGGPGQTGFTVMGVDASVISTQPPDAVLRGVLHVEMGEPGPLPGHQVQKHSIVVRVSPRPVGPRSILWLLGSNEAGGGLLEPDAENPYQAVASLLAGPPHWFSHRRGAPPYSEPLAEHALVVLSARAASEGVVTRQALLSYVASGGGVLFLGAYLEEADGRTLADWLGPVGVRLETAENVSGTFGVSGAPLLCRNWGSVAIDRGCRIQVEPPGTTLVRDPERGGAIFAIVPHGLGRIALLASGSPLEARAPSDAAHRRFVGDLIRWLDDAGREVSDVDGDGLPDSIEDANQNAALDPGETDRFEPDTDGDGIPDGMEDRNRNGRTDEGETSAVNPDSDGDGIWDGADLSPLPLAGTPVVEAVRPAEWPAEGGIWAQVTGRSFAPGLSVRFGERLAGRVRVLGPQGLEAEVPPADSAEGGTVDLVVEGSGAGQTGVLPGGFRYLPLSTVVLEMARANEPGEEVVRLFIDASSERPAQVDRLTLRLETKPSRAVEWLEVVAGPDALRNGRQVVSRPDPEGGVWVDVSPARAGQSLGRVIVVYCRPTGEGPDDIPRFTITRARAFAPNGAPLEVQTAY